MNILLSSICGIGIRFAVDMGMEGHYRSIVSFEKMGGWGFSFAKR
jgi:hypothetical protein